MHKAQFYEFGPFRLDPLKRLLLRDGQGVPLTPKAFDTLLVLVEHRGQVLEKDELMKTLWPDSFVEEANLAVNISSLRKVLGEHPHEHHYIATVPGRGYCFVASVKEAPYEGADLIVERTRAQIVIEEEEGSTVERIDPAKVPSMLLPRLRGSSWVVTLALACAVVALTAITLILYRHRTNSGESRPAPIRSIAVLPLKNLTDDPSNEYFSDGMTEGLITALSKIDGLKVISRGSVFRFKGKEIDPRDVGRQLGVVTVLEGGVRKSNGSVRVAVRLVSVEDGRVLWARETHEQTLGDLFALQDEVARRVVDALRLKLGHEGEQLLAKRYTADVEAYQAYLRGRYFWNKRTEEGFRKAINYFQQAIDIDPNYALAYAGLADSYILKRVFALLRPGETPQQMEAKARAAAEKALGIDETLAEAHTSLGLIKMLTGNDDADIERGYQRAIELNANYATAHHWYAMHLIEMGRFDEAMAEIRRAQDLDPLSLVINSDIGLVFFSARQYDQAVEHFKKAIEMDPNYPDAHAMLGWSYVKKGMYPEGIAEFQKARALFGSGTVPTVQLDGVIYAHGLSGNRSEALRALDELKRLTKQHQTQLPWVHWLLIHIGLGENDKAFEVLEKAYQEGVNIKPKLYSPYLDPLRSDPRFADLARRVSLAP